MDANMFLHHQREHSNDQFLGRRRLSNVVRERVKNHLVYYQLGVDKANKLRLNFRIPRHFGPPHLHVSGGFEDRGITQ